MSWRGRGESRWIAALRRRRGWERRRDQAGGLEGGVLSPAAVGEACRQCDERQDGDKQDGFAGVGLLAGGDDDVVVAERSDAGDLVERTPFLAVRLLAALGAAAGRAAAAGPFVAIVVDAIIGPVPLFPLQ